jgi:hypothetical protein
VDFFPSEEEKTSTSLGNKIYGNGISRRKSIETYRGHNSRKILVRNRQEERNMEQQAHVKKN